MVQPHTLIARTLAGLFSVSLLVIAQSAAAVDVPRGAISAPYEVANALRSLGVRPLASPWRRGMYWVAPAADRYGARVRVIVEAGSGRILDVSEIESAPPRPRRPIAGIPDGPRVVLRDGAVTDPVPPRGDAWADLDEEEYARPPRSLPTQPWAPRARPVPPQTWSPSTTESIPPQTRVTPAQPRARATQPAPRVAARPADPKPHAAPLPKPRPDIAKPDVAKVEPAPTPTAPAAPPAPPSVQAKPTPGAFPPAQGFE